MKKILSVCVAGLTWSAFSTPVLFPLQSLTGSANNRIITVQPDRTSATPLWFGTNLVPLFDFTLQPVNGQVTTNLAPWGYTIRVDGWPRSAHIVVPNSAAVLNVTTLINTNQFAPIQIFNTPQLNGGAGIMLTTNADGSITVNSSGFSGTIANLAAQSGVMTNPIYGITISGAGTVVDNGFYYATNSQFGNIVPGGSMLPSSWYFQKGDGQYVQYNYGWAYATNQTSSQNTNLLAWSIGYDYQQNWATNSFSPVTATWNSIPGTGAPNFGTLPNPTVVFTTNYLVTTNAFAHYNFTTFVNGVCVTNIYQ